MGAGWRRRRVVAPACRAGAPHWRSGAVVAARRVPARRRPPGRAHRRRRTGSGRSPPRGRPPSRGSGRRRKGLVRVRAREGQACGRDHRGAWQRCLSGRSRRSRRRRSSRSPRSKNAGGRASDRAEVPGRSPSPGRAGPVACTRPSRRGPPRWRPHRRGPARVARARSSRPAGVSTGGHRCTRTHCPRRRSTRPGATARRRRDPPTRASTR